MKWDNQSIYNAINEGLDELSEATGFYERYVTIPIVGNRTYYDLRGYLPENVVGVRSVWSTVREDWLVPISEENLGFQWEQSAGDPQHFFVRGISWLGVWPKADTTAGYLRVYFAGLAPHFTVPQDVLADLPDDFVPALEDYALYELAAQDRETDKALEHWREYVAREDGLYRFVNNRVVRARRGAIGGRR